MVRVGFTNGEDGLNAGLRNNRSRRFGEYISFSREEVMPTLTIEVLTAAQLPVSVDLNQLDDEQREALMDDIKEQLAQQGLPSRVKYVDNSATFTIDVEDDMVDTMLNADKGPLEDFAGVFDGAEHAFVIKRANGGRRRKTRKPKRKTRKTRRGVSRR
jgi:hypothetical protein